MKQLPCITFNNSH